MSFLETASYFLNLSSHASPLPELNRENPEELYNTLIEQAINEDLSIENLLRYLTPSKGESKKSDDIPNLNEFAKRLILRTNREKTEPLSTLLSRLIQNKVILSEHFSRIAAEDGDLRDSIIALQELYKSDFEIASRPPVDVARVMNDLWYQTGSFFTETVPNFLQGIPLIPPTVNPTTTAPLDALTNHQLNQRQEAAGRESLSTSSSDEDLKDNPRNASEALLQEFQNAPILPFIEATLRGEHPNTMAALHELAGHQDLSSQEFSEDMFESACQYFNAISFLRHQSIQLNLVQDGQKYTPIQFANLVRSHYRLTLIDGSSSPGHIASQIIQTMQEVDRIQSEESYIQSLLRGRSEEEHMKTIRELSETVSSGLSNPTFLSNAFQYTLVTKYSKKTTEPMLRSVLEHIPRDNSNVPLLRNDEKSFVETYAAHEKAIRQKAAVVGIENSEETPIYSLAQALLTRTGENPELLERLAEEEGTLASIALIAQVARVFSPSLSRGSSPAPQSRLDLLAQSLGASRYTPPSPSGRRSNSQSPIFTSLTNQQLPNSRPALDLNSENGEEDTTLSSLESPKKRLDNDRYQFITQDTAADLNDWLMIRECDGMTIAKIIVWALMIFSAGIVYGFMIMVAKCIDLGQTRKIEELELEQEMVDPDARV